MKKIEGKEEELTSMNCVWLRLRVRVMVGV